MVVGILTMAVLIHESRSLKAKRAVIRKLKDRVKNNFNVSIAEVGELDKWQVAHIGVTAVGNDQPYVNGTMEAVLRFVDRLGIVEIRDHDIELITGWDDQ